MKKITGHKDLDVWQKSMALVLDVDKLTQAFPAPELYALTAQIRRSAVPIPSNIAEGAARKNDEDFIRFYYISLGSLAEHEKQFIVAHQLKSLEDKIIAIKQLLNGLNASLYKKGHGFREAVGVYEAI